MTRYFVTGTDTGVGKTFVTSAMARRARELIPDAKVFAFKPIETGCPIGPAGLELGEDQLELTRAAGNWQTGSLRGRYQFRQPAAPLVAAEAEDQTIDLAELAELVQAGGTLATHVLVEGAGGWRVPITRDVDMGGFAKRLGFPVIVVGRAGLGTINHSLLTLEAVERDGCAVAALVLSKRPDEDADFVRSNVEQIARQWRGRVVVFDGRAAVLDELLEPANESRRS